MARARLLRATPDVRFVPSDLCFACQPAPPVPSPLPTVVTRSPPQPQPEPEPERRTGAGTCTSPSSAPLCRLYLVYFLQKERNLLSHHFHRLLFQKWQRSAYKNLNQKNQNLSRLPRRLHPHRLLLGRVHRGKAREYARSSYTSMRY